MFDLKEVKRMKRDMIRDFNSHVDGMKVDFKSFITHMSLDPVENKLTNKCDSIKTSQKKIKVGKKKMGRPATKRGS